MQLSHLRPEYYPPPPSTIPMVELYYYYWATERGAAAVELAFVKCGSGKAGGGCTAGPGPDVEEAIEAPQSLRSRESR